MPVFPASQPYALRSVVSDVTVTSPGLLAASVAVFTTCAQQVGVSALLRRHSISSTELVNYVFPWQVRMHAPTLKIAPHHPNQAGTLLLLGPIIDKLLCGSFPHTWSMPAEQEHTALGYVALSCSLAVGVNYSQVSTRSCRFTARPLTPMQFKCLSVMSPTGLPTPCD